MARKQDPITRILNDYASLDTSARSQVDAAIRGFRVGTGGTVGTTARRAPVTPRVRPVTASNETPSSN